ncbi:enoyl-CoA hydratase/isomerase family protein [Paraburkholderia sp. BL25I1N1]|uniref:enoyl-CoA hydratase/isomerase family protein n=1 Tax=Paraburkholderia sp. BL25I1N1 TaxID=1938804 RepID=UPI000D0609C0|nr:enoyl-CoA hydratase-related protein [Paraburkholderia sp. BL25I1N1]PRX96872.1 enoyl-CoA hydratase [Paraburkholderia sp. BL25I1N1]
MNLLNYQALLLERDGGVLTVTLNRPDTLNAFDEQMDIEMSRLFGDVADDPQTRVVVLTGAGRAFSAGGDIEHMQQVIDDQSLFLAGMQRAKKIIFSMLDCPKPVIAKINGHAVGLGATIALFSDLSYAANHAKIGDPHVKVGFVAGDGGAVIWPQLIGYAKAKEYLLTGDLLGAEEAARLGLINRAVPADELDAVVDAMAKRLATGASQAIQWTKTSINIGLKQLAHSILDASIAYEALSNQTEDHQEAVNAFREKRDPVFKGR